MDFLPSLCNDMMIKDCMLFISADRHTNIRNAMINGVAASLTTNIREVVLLPQ